MKVSRAENYVWIFVPRAEAEYAKREPGKVKYLEAKDAKGRNYILINTAHSEQHVRFEENESPSGHHTVKINDAALKNLLETKRVRQKYGRIEITVEIEDNASEGLLKT